MVLRTDQGGDPDASKSMLPLWIKAGNTCAILCEVLCPVVPKE